MIDLIKDNESFTLFIGELANVGDVIILPIAEYKDKHSTINRISFIYFYFISTKLEYILPFNHPDCDNLSVKEFSILLNEIKTFKNKIYVYNKKSTIALLQTFNLIDVESMEYYKYGTLKTNLKIYNNIVNFFKKKFNEKIKLNLVIPLLKHFEYLTELKNKLISIIDDCKDILDESGFKNINDISINTFATMEANGIYVNKLFKNGVLVNDNYVYSDYNLFTMTGRPSSNGFNFISLNKKNGDRKPFVSRFGNNGRLIYMDYRARHIYLISNIIDEKFETDPYTDFGKVFFGKDVLTDEEYAESKKVTFNVMYGGIPDEFKVIPFFEKTKKYMMELHHAYEVDGFITTPLFKKKLYKNTLGKLKPSKLFNYYFQAVETEYGIEAMSKILKVLKENKYDSKMILYIYDGFLIDFKLSDGVDAREKIKNALTKDNLYPISTYFGSNYHNLVKV